MSAFVVRDQTINTIVTFLEFDRDNGHWIRQQLASKLGLASPEDIGRAMLALNITAVNARYGDGEAATFRPLDYTYEPVLANEFQVFKSLRCWLYQCSNSDVPEAPLYRIMDSYCQNVAYNIIADLPEYERANWD